VVEQAKQKAFGVEFEERLAKLEETVAKLLKPAASRAWHRQGTDRQRHAPGEAVFSGFGHSGRNLRY
jgi:hypothetical protein